MGSGARVVYVDLLLLTILANFLFDWLLLWATAEVTRRRVGRRRLFLGTAVGTLHFAFYMLAAQGVVGHYGLLRYPATVAAVSLLMLLVTFWPVTLRALPRLIGSFYAILFLSAGAGLAAGNIWGPGNEPNVIISFIVAAAALLVVAEAGWGIVQRRFARQAYQVPVEVRLGDRIATFTGLIDTGNHLVDPLGGGPVVIAEVDALKPLFPPELHPDLALLADGDLSPVTNLAVNADWSARFRIIPFRSLGQDHGLLVGFKPDSVTLHLPEPAPYGGTVTIALSRRRLDPAGLYQALVPPDLLTHAPAVPKAAPAETSWPPLDASISSKIESKGGHSVADSQST